MRRRIGRAVRLWTGGFRLGLNCLPRYPLLGLKRLMLPISYWRTAEFGYAVQRLAVPGGSRVLDLGSPKELAVLLARTRGFEVVSTDILPKEVEISRRYATAAGIVGNGAGTVRSEVQDGRALAYPDGHFDAAFSISVLEHIPGAGDTTAMRELIRVVKPGGLIVVTTPFDRQYRETFVDRAVYERAQHGAEQMFFERHYDASALQERLLSVPGAQVLDLQVWGEGRVRVEHLLGRLGRVRDLLSPFEAGLSALFLRRIEQHDTGSPMAVFFVLQRVASPTG